ncbi:MAG: BglII/BstYI family type II restriction endonuclease [Pseudomonas sp.]
MALEDIPTQLREDFEIHEWRHATAILASDFPVEWGQILEMLENFRLYKSWLEVGGGNRSKIAAWVDHTLGEDGWIETKFDTQIKVDETTRNSPTHKVDCFKNRVALEVEWNNKDPFYDRDLNNFRLLFDLGVVSVGVIFTRSDELQEIFNDLGRGSSYGESTTHMSKLLPRIEGGGGGGCPLLVIGINKSLLTDDEPPVVPKKTKKRVQKKTKPLRAPLLELKPD